MNTIDTTLLPVIAGRAKTLVARYNKHVRWHNAIKRYLDDGAVHPYDAPKGSVQRCRMPSKQLKGWMYDDAYVVARALGMDIRCQTLHDIGLVAEAARKAGFVRKVATAIFDYRR